MDRDVVNRFSADASALILELGLYAAQSERTEEDSADVRKLRILSSAILSACEAIGRVVPPPTPIIPPLSAASQAR